MPKKVIVNSPFAMVVLLIFLLFIGSTADASKTVIVAEAGPDQDVLVDDKVTLDGSGSASSKGQLTYKWAFASKPACSKAVLSKTTAVRPTFVPDCPGVYKVNLIVSYCNSKSIPDTVTITAVKSPPSAEAGPDQAVYVGESVTLDGSGSKSTDKSGLKTVFGPKTYMKKTNRPETYTNRFLVSDYDRNFYLIATDGNVLNRITDAVIRINGVQIFPASASGVMAASPAHSPTFKLLSSNTITVELLSGKIGASIGVKIVEDVDNRALAYSWSIVSKPEGSTALLSDPTSVRPTFTADLSGTYQVRLIVYDGAAVSAPDTVTISTLNSIPVADAGPDQTAYVSSTVTLDGSRSTDVDRDPLTYLWSLAAAPAGSTAALSDTGAVNPTFVVDRQGNYQFRLVVNDGKGDSAPDTVTISTLNSIPVADAGPDQTAYVNSTVTLDGSRSTDVDGDPLTYRWTLTSAPSGSAAELSDAAAVNPTFVVDRQGNYQFRLVVNDGKGDSAPDTVTISTLNSIPVADAGPDQTAYVNSTVTLDGSRSTDVDGDPLTYRWSFTTRPSGSVSVLLNSSGINPTFTTDLAGLYVLQLIVNDGTADSLPDTVTISTSVLNSPPVAEAGIDQTVAFGSTVLLGGGGSSDPDGDALTYLWSITSKPEGSSALISDQTVSPSFVADLTGTYIIQLIVHDGHVSSAPDTVTITSEATVSNLPPVADAGADQTITLTYGQTMANVTLNGGNSSDPDGTVTAYTWSGTPKPADTVNPVVSLSPGVYTFTLSVTDNNGASGNEDSVTITVNSAPLPNQPQLTVPASRYEVNEGTPDPLTINVTASDPDGTPVSVSASPRLTNAGFTASGGPTATGIFTFKPDFGQRGIYDVTFTAIDPTGLTDDRTVQITVNKTNRPPVITVDQNFSMKEGEILTIPVTVSDPDSDALSVRAFISGNPGQPLPDNAMFIEPTRTFSFSPDFTQAGVYDITFEVSDGQSTAQSAAHILVDDVQGGGTSAELVLQVDPLESPSLLSRLRVTGTVNAASSPRPPSRSVLITGMSPTTAQQGATLVVTLRGETAGRYATHFIQGTSTASFGDNITVNSVQINSSSEALVSITIAQSAFIGPRSAMVTTDREVAVSTLAFSVVQGTSTATGRLVDKETGNPISGAIVTIQGTNIRTITGADGTFTLQNVPPGQHTVVINPQNHRLMTMNIGSSLGTTTELGELQSQATVFDPAAPPAATVFSIVGRGAGDISHAGLSQEDAKKLVIDTLIAVGGTEGGVLDEFGNQLNPAVTGNGLASLKSQGVDDIAASLLTGDTHSLGEIMALFLRMFDYKGQPVPRLTRVLQGIQNQVDYAWSNPESGSPLMIALFNQQRSILGDPPKVNLDTTLNSLQTYLLITSLMSFVHKEISALSPQNASVQAQPVLAANAAAPILAADAPPAKSGFSVPWEDVFEFAEPKVISNLKSKGIEICKKLTTVAPPATCGNNQIDAGEDCDGTPGCGSNCKFSIIPPAPGCKETAELASLLFADLGDDMTKGSERFAQFFMSENATRETSERIRQQFKNENFQKAWGEAKKEAAALGKLQKVLEFGKTFVMDALDNMAGDIAGTILNLEADMIIDSLRPDPPLITSIEQLGDPTTGKPTNMVKITFQRSLKDPANTEGNQTWFYELWKQQGGGSVFVTSGRVRTPEQGPGPRPTADSRTLYFYDTEASEGTALYRIRATRLIGQIVTEEPPTVVDTLVQMAAGFVPLNFATPGGITVMSGGTLKMILDPAAKILEGIKIQKSLFSDPAPVYVTLRDRPVPPPANIAVDWFSGATYMSIPAFGRIYKILDGEMSNFVDSGFKTPYQIGLAIDSRGYLYADNSASDMQFGGRVFRYDQKTGNRSFVGTVNYYSFQLMYARPVMVQSMVIGPSTQYGEALYIADGLNNRITQLRLPESLPAGMDLSRNVSQPYAESEKFFFSTNTAMAFRGDGMMFVTNGPDLFLIPPGGGRVDSLFNDSFAMSPFTSLSGVTVDRMGNLYVSDSQLNTIVMLPMDAQIPNIGLVGYDEVKRKKLALIRGANKPTQVQLAANGRGLIYFDATGLHSIGFGMSGQVKDVSGNPLPGVKVSSSDQELNRLSVSDGDGAYVLPDLVSGSNNVVEINIRYNNQTQTERVVLDPMKHNIVDFVFNPPAPQTGSSAINITVPPVPVPPVELSVRPGDTALMNRNISVPKINPGEVPAQNTLPTRVATMSPGDGSVITDAITTVKGFTNDPSITEGIAVINGVEQVVQITDGEFSIPVSLVSGENNVVIKVVEGGAKGALISGSKQAVTDVGVEIDTVGEGFGRTMNAAGAFRGGSTDAVIARLPAGPVRSEIQADFSAFKNVAATVSSSLLSGRLPDQTAVDELVNRAGQLNVKAQGIGGGMIGIGAGAVKAIFGDTADSAAVMNGIIQNIGQQIDEARVDLQAQYERMAQLLADFQQTAPAIAERDTIVTTTTDFQSSLQALISRYSARSLPVDSEQQNLLQRLTDLQNVTSGLTGAFDQTVQGTIQNMRDAGGESSSSAVSSINRIAPNVGRVSIQSGMLHGVSMSVAYDAIAPLFSTLPEALGMIDSITSLSAGNFSELILGQMATALASLKNETSTLSTTISNSQGLLGPVTGRMLLGASAFHSELGSLSFENGAAALARAHQGSSMLMNILSGVKTLTGNVLGLPSDRVPPTTGVLTGMLEGSLKGAADQLAAGSLPTAAMGDLLPMSGLFKNLFTVQSGTLRITGASADEAPALMEKKGFDVTIAGRVRDSETGLPVAGLKMGIPGSGAEVTTDADGVYRLQMKLQQIDQCLQLINSMLKSQHDMMKSVIQNLRAFNVPDQTKMYAALDSYIASDAGSGGLFDDQGISAFILSATTVQNMLPHCTSAGDEIKTIAERLEAVATAAYSRIESGNNTTPAERQELQAKLEEMNSMLNTMTSIMKAQQETNMAIIRNMGR